MEAALRELDRAEPPANHFFHRVTAERGCSDHQLTPFFVISDDSSDVRHVAAVIFKVQPAACGHAGWKPHAHRCGHSRDMMHEHIGERPTTKWPQASPLREACAVERLLARRRTHGISGTL